MMMCFETKVPGKLMLVGEWSVLETSCEECGCVVLPISRFLTCKIEESKDEFSYLSLPDIIAKEDNHSTLQIIWDSKSMSFSEVSNLTHPEALLVLTALSITFKTTLNPISFKPFKLTVLSDISGSSEKKFGLGSSSAVLVATISVALRWCGVVNASPMRLFRTAIIVQSSVIGHSKGSGFDIAAAAFATPLYYKRFDSLWLNEMISNSKNDPNLLGLLIDENKTPNWKRLEIEPLVWPQNNLKLLACFSGNGASTNGLISAMEKSKHDSNSMSEHLRILKEIGIIAITIRDILKSKERRRIFELPKLVKANRLLLQQLENLTGIVLETNNLKSIIETAEKIDENSVGSKISGAGGGDCAIAIVTGENEYELTQISEKIQSSWLSFGFTPLFDLQIVTK